MGPCASKRSQRGVTQYDYNDPRIDAAFPEAEETAEASVSLFVGTWNMGNAPPAENLHEFIKPGVADIYMIGTQECKYDAPKGQSYVDHWFQSVIDTLGESYRVVLKEEMWQNNIIILAHNRIHPLIDNVETQTEATGIGGVVANKGGLAGAFSICNTSICFVSSHLAAHQDKSDDREEDYREIIAGMRFGNRDRPVTNLFTHLVWVGDLNYRVDLEREECEALVAKSDWTTLAASDQLNIQRDQGRVFYLFNEGPIQFAPTFKHTHGEGPRPDGRRPYETKKMRVPSWTDRVQWRSFPGCDLRLKRGTYTSCPQVCSSDHSPVCAQFQCPVDLPHRRDVTSSQGTITLLLSNLKGEDLKPRDPQKILTAIANGVRRGSNRTVKDTEQEMEVEEECSTRKNKKKSMMKQKSVYLGDLPDETSDPYCVFTTDWTVGKLATEVVHKTLNPEWEGSYKLASISGISSREWVQRRHVQVSVMDKDKTKSDRMGFGVIPLTGAQHSPQAFTIPLTLNGQPAGELSGTVEIIGGYSGSCRRPSSLPTAIGSSNYLGLVGWAKRSFRALKNNEACNNSEARHSGAPPLSAGNGGTGPPLSAGKADITGDELRA